MSSSQVEAWLASLPRAEVPTASELEQQYLDAMRRHAETMLSQSSDPLNVIAVAFVLGCIDIVADELRTARCTHANTRFVRYGAWTMRGPHPRGRTVRVYDCADCGAHLDDDTADRSLRPHPGPRVDKHGVAY